MCRHFSYLGEPVVLGELVSAAPHSLVVQAATPDDMRGGGTVNVDGFGVGWYAEGSVTATRYRRPVPIWQDGSFTELSHRTIVTGALGAVRSATPGMAVAEAACAPFTDGHWLFSLNGRIQGWPGTAVALAETIPTGSLLSLDALTDSALLWAVLRHRLGTDPSADPAGILARLVSEVLAEAPGSRLNLLLTDGRRSYGTTVTHSLWSRHTPDGVLLASEPFDDDAAWQPVADQRVLAADRSGITEVPL